MKRTITVERCDTGETRDIVVRALKRKEIKALQSCGYTYLGCIPKYETAQETIDTALDLVVSPSDLKFLDECDTAATKTVWSEILKETYGDPESEKNSGNTTDGTSTATE